MKNVVFASIYGTVITTRTKKHNTNKLIISENTMPAMLGMDVVDIDSLYQLKHIVSMLDADLYLMDLHYHQNEKMFNYIVEIFKTIGLYEYWNERTLDVKFKKKSFFNFTLHYEEEIYKLIEEEKYNFDDVLVLSSQHIYGIFNENLVCTCLLEGISSTLGLQIRNKILMKNYSDKMLKKLCKEIILEPIIKIKKTNDIINNYIIDFFPIDCNKYPIPIVHAVQNISTLLTDNLNKNKRFNEIIESYKIMFLTNKDISLLQEQLNKEAIYICSSMFPNGDSQFKKIFLKDYLGIPEKIVIQSYRDLEQESSL